MEESATTRAPLNDDEIEFEVIDPREKKASGEKEPPVEQEKEILPSAQEKAVAFAEEKKRRLEKKAELSASRSGGVYVPPFKLARLRDQAAKDPKSRVYQRTQWDALRKSINGLINKVNTSNIKEIVPEIFSENIVRGRGLVCRSIMKAQMASPPFTHVYAALIAVLNTKMPELGELLLKRVIMQFRRAYKRNDKLVTMACTKFLAHLVNQQVAHELIALQLLTLLLEKPTDDSVEVAVDFVKECGVMLTELSPRGMHGIFERFRGILHEGEIDKRVQYIIEGLFAVRKNAFKDYPAVVAELDLVNTDDQITHELSLDENHDQEASLNIFHMDPEYEENEKQYASIKKEILGDDEGEGSDSSDSEAEEGDEPKKEAKEDEKKDDEPGGLDITDKTDQKTINLRRTIYLTIMSSLEFQECAHKLLKLEELKGQEVELCNMLIECCSQERTYLRFYGLLGERFCQIGQIYQEKMDECFALHYATIHRFETNRLRNIAKFFAHLLYTDALEWSVLSYIRLNEEETTSSSRIFIKILFRELSEMKGLGKLKERLEDPTLAEYFQGLFPRDNPKNARFSINFFTSIGLGGITESLRSWLKLQPKLIMKQLQPTPAAPTGSDSDDSDDSDSDSDSDDSDDSDDSSDSDSDEDKGKQASKKGKKDTENTKSKKNKEKKQDTENAKGGKNKRDTESSKVTKEKVAKSDHPKEREIPKNNKRLSRSPSPPPRRSPAPRRRSPRRSLSPKKTCFPSSSFTAIAFPQKTGSTTIGFFTN